LNREDGGRRRFILAEMGAHFESVIVPRVKKVAFGPEWKDGKPVRPATKEESDRGPRMIKIICLESYEDALNNLDTRRTKAQSSLLDTPEAAGADGLKEEYLLRYVLDVETRGSQSLLNVAAFSDPTEYRLKVKVAGTDQSREMNVDLLETFNYLVGLTVRHIATPQSFQAEFKRDEENRLRLDGRLKQDAVGPWWFRTVQGVVPDGRNALLIWRKLTGDAEKDNLVLDEWFTRQGYSTKDYEFDLIFVNGDNNLENLRQADETWKVRLIEEDFHRLMFDVRNV
jgi:adenine-specific DNA-methyltransferase